MNLKQLITSAIEKIEQNKYWFLSFCLLIFFSITYLGYPNMCGYGYDFWEHTAALEELSYNLASPKNPQLLSDIPSPRFMPYILILAVIKNLTGLSAFSMMTLASMATFLIFSIGLYLFTTEYFNDKNQALYTLIVMLLFWGTGIYYSSDYSFRAMRTIPCYPSIFSFCLSFSGFYFVLKYIKLKNLRYYFYSLVLGFIIFLSHSPTGSFFFLAILLLVLSERNNIVTKLTVFCLPIIVLISSCFWPYFSIDDLMFGSMTLKAWVPSSFYSPHVIYQLGPVLLGIPIIFNYFIRKEYKFVYYGFASCFLIYIISGIMKIPLGERYIFFFVFFLHLAIARELRVRNLLSFTTIKRVFCSNEKNKRRVINISLALLLFSTILFNIGWSYAGNFADKEDDKIIVHEYRAYDHMDFNEYNFLKEKVGRYEVVLSDKTTSWLIPAYSGKAVCIIHENPLIPDCCERLDDVGTFFDANTTSEARLGIIKKYNVSYILLNLDLELFDDETIVAITELGNITFQNSHFILIEIEANNKE